MNLLWKLRATAAVGLTVLTLTACTGGQETSASTETTDGATTTSETAAVDARKQIASISDAIPVYPGVEYRPDLSDRDVVLLRNQYGPQTQVFTMATNDSFPKVWHYYVNYLAQYRGYDPPAPYPPESKQWRTMQVNLNQAMQDPFVPGEQLQLANRQIILQLAETEAEPATVVRYIITTPQPTVVASTTEGGSDPGASLQQ